MEWKKLLLTQKLGAEESEPDALKEYPMSNFEKDYEKIVSSAAFRRLQDKTQVFPLDKSDFVRTRLTHSIEVSTIARQLGLMMTKNIMKQGKDKFQPEEIESIPAILQCAGLLHDLGNPPFGHFGETVIGDWFKSNLSQIPYGPQEKEKPPKTLRTVLEERYCKDLENFEGNAQAFRILAKSMYGCGIDVSKAVMSTLVKYTAKSADFNAKAQAVQNHKPGCYFAEEDIFRSVAESTGTLIKNGKISRHPLAYLLEAADDIAYRTADLEDAFKKGLFTFDQFVKFFDDKLAEMEQEGEVPQHIEYSRRLIKELKDQKESGKSEEEALDRKSVV